MLKTGLEFAPGTTDDSKRAIGRLFKPGEILAAYRDARSQCKTGDLVLVASDQVPGIRGGTRVEYVRHLRKIFGARAREFKMYSHPAHSVMMLPFEADAMWFVLDIGNSLLPVMAVLYATPYEVEVEPETPELVSN